MQKFSGSPSHSSNQRGSGMLRAMHLPDHQTLKDRNMNVLSGPFIWNDKKPHKHKF